MDQIDLSRPRTLRQYLRIYLTGFAMGAADIVPGVSGGTMAFILGIYEALIDAIKSFDITTIRLALSLKFKEILERIPFGFLIALGLGILSAIFALSNALGMALETHAEFVFAFFGGLVVASIIAIGAKVKWTPVNIIITIVFTLGAFILVGLNPMQDAPHAPHILFLSGLVAIVAMILPGISGSFILLLLGQYKFILDAVRSLDIVSIISLGLGCLVGIVTFSRVLSWLLKHYEQMTIAALVGFMIGSLRKIWEGAPEGSTPIEGMKVVFDQSPADIAIALVLFVLGFVVVSLLDHVQSRNNPLVRLVRRPSA